MCIIFIVIKQHKVDKTVSLTNLFCTIHKNVALFKMFISKKQHAMKQMKNVAAHHHLLSTTYYLAEVCGL